MLKIATRNVKYNIKKDPNLICPWIKLGEKL